MGGCLMSLIEMSSIEWSAADEPLPGQKQSGDRYVVKSSPAGALLAVVDGIGHGEDAAHTAELAVSALNNSDAGSLISLLRCCQQQLQGTRGAVLSMAMFSLADDTMTWLGVGNVEGVLLRREAYGVARQESLLLRGGVVGAQLPSISASVIPVSYGDTLIFATDGIRGGFADNLNINASTQEIARYIIEHHWRKIDDALVLVARYVHKSESSPQY
jgi:negative regulator of sigma-B (phosphoserine phosphatase)